MDIEYADIRIYTHWLHSLKESVDIILMAIFLLEIYKSHSLKDILTLLKKAIEYINFKSPKWDSTLGNYNRRFSEGIPNM